MDSQDCFLPICGHRLEGKPKLLDAQADYTVGPNTPVNLLKILAMIVHTCNLRAGDGDRRTFGVYWQASLV